MDQDITNRTHHYASEKLAEQIRETLPMKLSEIMREQWFHQRNELRFSNEFSQQAALNNITALLEEIRHAAVNGFYDWLLEKKRP